MVSGRLARVSRCHAGSESAVRLIEDRPDARVSVSLAVRRNPLRIKDLQDGGLEAQRPGGPLKSCSFGLAGEGDDNTGLLLGNRGLVGDRMFVGGALHTGTANRLNPKAPRWRCRRGSVRAGWR